MKKVVWLLVLLAVLVVGGVLIWQGYGELQTSRKLTIDGVSTLANVLGAREERSLLGSRFVLELEFRAVDGDIVESSVKVNERGYVEATGQGLVDIFYLPDDRTRLAVGREVRIRYHKFALGIGLILISAILLVVGNLTASFNKA